MIFSPDVLSPTLQHKGLLASLADSDTPPTGWDGGSISRFLYHNDKQPDNVLLADRLTKKTKTGHLLKNRLLLKVIHPRQTQKAINRCGNRPCLL